MKDTALSPFHLFQYRGANYAFEIESSAVMRLDDSAYDALVSRLAGEPDDVLYNRLAAGFGPEQTETVLNELAALERGGLLRGPVSTYDDGEQ